MCKCCITLTNDNYADKYSYEKTRYQSFFLGNSFRTTIVRVFLLHINVDLTATCMQLYMFAHNWSLYSYQYDIWFWLLCFSTSFCSLVRNQVWVHLCRVESRSSHLQFVKNKNKSDIYLFGRKWCWHFSWNSFVGNLWIVAQIALNSIS